MFLLAALLDGVATQARARQGNGGLRHRGLPHSRVCIQAGGCGVHVAHAALHNRRATAMQLGSHVVRGGCHAGGPGLHAGGFRRTPECQKERHGQQQSIQARENSSSVMPSGICSFALGWPCARRVLCTKGSRETQQQPCHRSVGNEQEAVKENPLPCEQGLKQCSNEPYFLMNSGAPRDTPSATRSPKVAKPHRADSKARLPTQTSPSGASESTPSGDHRAVPNSNLTKIETKLGTMPRMALETAVKLVGPCSEVEPRCMRRPGTTRFAGGRCNAKANMSGLPCSLLSAWVILGDAVRLQASRPHAHRLAGVHKASKGVRTGGNKAKACGSWHFCTLPARVTAVPSGQRTTVGVVLSSLCGKCSIDGTLGAVPEREAIAHDLDAPGVVNGHIEV